MRVREYALGLIRAESCHQQTHTHTGEEVGGGVDRVFEIEESGGWGGVGKGGWGVEEVNKTKKEQKEKERERKK